MTAHYIARAGEPASVGGTPERPSIVLYLFCTVPGTVRVTSRGDWT